MVRGRIPGDRRSRARPWSPFLCLNECRTRRATPLWLGSAVWMEQVLLHFDAIGAPRRLTATRPPHRPTPGRFYASEPWLRGSHVAERRLRARFRISFSGRPEWNRRASATKRSSAAARAAAVAALRSRTRAQRSWAARRAREARSPVPSGRSARSGGFGPVGAPARLAQLQRLVGLFGGAIAEKIASQASVPTGVGHRRGIGSDRMSPSAARRPLGNIGTVAHARPAV